MRNDYAKHKFSSKKAKKGYLYLWLSLLSLFGAALIGLLILNQNNRWDSKLTQLNFIASIAPKPKPTASATTAPTFDFYNISPQNQKIKTEITYELEIAIVDNFAAADHLKAELALLGFGASITPIYQHNIQKYYVSIGPYTNKERAVADQRRLKTNRIKNLLKVVKSLPSTITDK